MSDNCYRFVVLGSDWDVYQYAFRDLIENKFITYIPTFRPLGLLGKLQRIHLNPQLNKHIPLPGKSLWGKHIANNIKDKTGSKACILVIENWLRMESALHMLPILRSKFPDAKIVCFAQDLITRIDDMYTLRHVDVDYVKQYSDLFITFDTNDAKKYDLDYFPTVFSVPTNLPVSNERNTDMYFLGRDKGRLPLLTKLCDLFHTKGLTCNFQILESTNTDRLEQKGVYYTDSPTNYRDNLLNVAHSHCIVEVLQENALSSTFRLWEAIVLNKKILTNNTAVLSSPLYDPRYISTFTSEIDIDWAFIENIREPAFPDKNPHCLHIQPESLIKHIESSLNINICR